MRLVLEPEVIGTHRGFVEIDFTKADPKPLIRTLDQYYHRETGKWVTTFLFTSDKDPFTGRVNYRRPVTLRAKLIAIFPGWFVTVWRRKVACLWDRQT